MRKIKISLVFVVTVLLCHVSRSACPTDAADLANGGTFDGTCPIDITGNITITGAVIWTAGTLTLNNGNMTVGAGGSIDIQGGTVTMGSGLLTIDAGQSVTVGAGANLNGADNQDIDVNGILDVYGTVTTFNANGGDIDVSGATAVLTIYSGGHVTCADDFQVTNGGTLDVQSGSTMYFEDNLRNSDEGVTSGNAYIIINGDVTSGNGNGDGSRITIVDTTPNSELSGTGTVDIDNDVDDQEGGDFSGCTGGSSCMGLPVKLISFDATTKKGQATLNWITGSELNNQGFYIEKSTDGASFNQIGFVNGFGTTSEIQHYSFEDQNYIGESYYRLKQIDYDGAFEYSPIVFASSSEIQKLSIHPNPSANVVKLGIESDGVFNFVMIDISGAVLINSIDMDISGIETLINEKTSNMENGVYYLKLYNRFQTFESRLILSR